MGANRSLPANPRTRASSSRQEQIAAWQQLVTCLETETLQAGDQGPAVQHLQQILQTLALYNRPVDGCFGRATEASLRQLQRQFGLAETGTFDADLWYALSFWSKPSFESDGL